MHNSPFRYGQHHSQDMEKHRAAFPHPANSVAHSSIRRGVIHITHNADCGGIPPTYSFPHEKSKDFFKKKSLNISVKALVNLS